MTAGHDPRPVPRDDHAGLVDEVAGCADATLRELASNRLRAASRLVPTLACNPGAAVATRAGDHPDDLRDEAVLEAAARLVDALRGTGGWTPRVAAPSNAIDRVVGP